MRFLFQWGIFRFHVNFRGCKLQFLEQCWHSTRLLTKICGNCICLVPSWGNLFEDFFNVLLSKDTFMFFLRVLSSFGCMRRGWNQFDDARLLPDEVFENTSRCCDQYKWLLHIQLRLGSKSMSNYVVLTILYVVFVWLFVNQRFRFSMIVITPDRAVSLSVLRQGNHFS